MTFTLFLMSVSDRFMPLLLARLVCFALLAQLLHIMHKAVTQNVIVWLCVSVFCISTVKGNAAVS